MARRPTLDDARRALQARYGYPDFRGMQADVVRAVLDGGDVVALMPTGAGKSVCFQIPAELVEGTTLVVSPLISLMADQVARLRSLGYAAGALHAALDTAERDRTLSAFAAGTLTLLYVAPERFDSPRFAAALERVRIARLVIDEAHCLVSWGGSFRPSYRRLGRVRARLACPCTALTATATPDVRQEIIATLGLVNPTVVASGVDRPNLRWEVERARDRREKDRALLRLVPRVGDGCTMVYAATRRTTDALADLLRGRGVDAVAYHAGVAPAERSRIQDRFIAGAARVIVATSAFGMGIDRPDVRRVLHYDMPSALEDYAQEAGRGGRDGAPARCVLLYARGDEAIQRHLIRLGHPSPATLRRLLRFLRSRAASSGTVGERWGSATIGRGRTSTTGSEPAGPAAEGPARSAETWTGWPTVRVRPVEVLGAVRGLAGAPQIEAALRLLREAGVAHPWSDLRSGNSAGQAAVNDLGNRGSGGLGNGALAGRTSEAGEAVWAIRPQGPLAEAALRRDRNAYDREVRGLGAMRAYATGRSCRRARILRHFGEVAPVAACGNCDACSPAVVPAASARAGRGLRALFAAGLRS